MPAFPYTEVANLSIAYQVCGSGPVDLVYVPGLYSHVEAVWDLPGFPEWMERLVRSRASSRSTSVGVACRTPW
jgi:hypothetical protein